ncbi:MAG TPA: ornithine carbamoyltransferase [Pseudomonadales bacterium]|nr:ornithine carbamoyltransferase [Pseudomonadales bacterium]
MGKMRHIPSLKDFSAEEINEILRKSAEIKANPEDFYNALHRQSLAMLFQKTSTRTRVSFEAAMTELGGHAIYIDWSTSNFVLSGLEHETQYLSRNVACIMARLMHHSDLLKIISASQVPVINGCCEIFHPCQALTDVLTMSEHYDGDLSEAHLAYVGVQNNVSNSLTVICDKLGIQLTLATPEQQDNGESLDADVQAIISSSAKINHTTDPRAAVQDADFVYTDTWIDMQYFNNLDHKDENEAKLKQMMPYQLNKTLLKGIDCKVMHDMPIHDGFEISAELTRDPRAIIYPQSENRMHAQKGLLWWLLARD